MNKEDYLKFAKETSVKAGERILSSFRREAPKERGTSKEVKSVVDEVADEIIIKEIEKRFPSHSYLTEETGLVEKEEDYLWVVDPLDGTGNFMNHNPVFSVSIALYQEKRPVVGVVNAPFLKERFFALKGEGAFHEDLLTKKEERLAVSSLEELSLAYFAFCEGGERDKERITKIFSHLYKKTKEVRKIGSAALELSFLAQGRVDGYYTTRIRFWDIAAGLLIAKEAGADILRFNGEPFLWEDFFKEEKVDLLGLNGHLDIDLKGF